MSRAAAASRSIPGLGFRHSQSRLSAGSDRVGVMQAVPVVVDLDSALGEQSNDGRMGAEKIVVRSLSLGCAWLVRDNDRTVIEGPDTTDRVGRTGSEPDVLLDIRSFERPVHVVPDEFDDDSVPVEKDGGDAHSPAAISTDSHFPGAVASAGCETRRCHTIAWNSST